MSLDKRRWKRVDFSVLGMFVQPQQHTHGTLRAVDFCRQGMRAQIQHSIPRGSTLGVSMQLSDKQVPVWLTGRVVWVKINPEPTKAYPFETGIQVDVLNDGDVAGMMLSGGEEEYLEKLAETAMYKGILFREGVRGRDDGQYLLPAGFLTYAAIGAAASFLNAGFGAYYIVSMGGYLVGLCAANYIAYGVRHGKRGLSAGATMRLSMVANIILTHLCKGIYFLRGVFKKSHSSAHA